MSEEIRCEVSREVGRGGTVVEWFIPDEAILRMSREEFLRVLGHATSRFTNTALEAWDRSHRKLQEVP